MSTIRLRPIEDKVRPPKLALLSIGLLFTGVIALFLLIRSRQPHTVLPPKPVEFVQVTQAVTLGQDLLIAVDNVSFFMPKDAVTLEGHLFITQVQPDQYLVAGQSGWYQLQLVDVEYRDSNGKPYPWIVFYNPAQMCFTLSEEQWKDYNQRPSDYQIQYYADQENPPTWEPLLKTLNPEQKQVCGSSYHLSLFALAVWQQDYVPVTGLIATPTPTEFSFLDLLGIHGSGSAFTATSTRPVPTSAVIHPTSTMPAPTATAPASTATQPPAPTATQPPAPTATQPPAPTATQPPAPTATQPPAPTVRPTSEFPTKTPFPTKTQFVPPADTATDPPATNPPTEPPVATDPPTQPPATEPPVTDVPTP